MYEIWVYYRRATRSRQKWMYAEDFTLYSIPKTSVDLYATTGELNQT
jgi:hypothetical protein